MRYREYPVDPRLTSYVACYWTLELAHQIDGPHPVLPDGCIDLLFASRANTLKFVGTMTKTLWTNPSRPTALAGVRFKPAGAVPFLRDRADLLTDQVAPFEAVRSCRAAGIQARLQQAISARERVGLLEHELLSWLADDVSAVEPRIAWASAALRANPGLRLRALTDPLGVSRQQLRRLFLQHTGLSPKTFARIARLRTAVHVLPHAATLVDAAVTAGYADQAHMTHEFNDLVGVTPATFRRRR